jgi:hypothetical protein
LPNTYEDITSLVDPTEEFCYKVLKRNGFAPEWVELNKTIFSELDQAKGTFERTLVCGILLLEEPKANSQAVTQQDSFFLKIFSALLQPLPDSKKSKSSTFSERLNILQSCLKEFHQRIRSINERVNTYNLMVPMARQLYQFDTAIELEPILDKYPLDKTKLNDNERQSLTQHIEEFRSHVKMSNSSAVHKFGASLV